MGEVAGVVVWAFGEAFPSGRILEVVGSCDVGVAGCLRVLDVVGGIAEEAGGATARGIDETWRSVLRRAREEANAGLNGLDACV